MTDLKFSYTSPQAKRIHKEYETIMDFLEDVKNGNLPLNGIQVNARFFENKLHNKQFKTLNDLYLHCINITK